MPMKKSKQLKKPVAAKKVGHPRNTESLIAESFIIRLPLEHVEAGSLLTLPSDCDSIFAALRAICNAPKDTVVPFYGRDHIFIWPHEMKPKQGTQILSSGDDEHHRSVHAQVVLAPKDRPGQHIRVTYRLYLNGLRENGGPFYFLECQGNPTTVVAGNNVVPVTTADPETGALEPLPSSSRDSMTTVNRVLFELLEALNRTVVGTQAPLFDPERVEAIKRGDFELVRTQFCCYLPTKNVPIFLQLLTILYAPLVMQADGMINVADHLGLKVKHFVDKMHRVTGIQFQWRHGKKMVVSVSFYDKRKRVAQMRQGQTLDVSEKGLVKNNVRFDITVHKRGIEKIIGQARKLLEERREAYPALFEDLVAKEFLEDKPQATMWWFENAITVLSTTSVGGKLQRKSFSNWLVSRALGGILQLKSIVKCTPAKLHAFIELDEPVVKAWYAADKFDPRSWAKEIVKLSELEKTAVYTHRARLLKEHDIDIAIPYPFYRDLEHFGPKSLTTPENREAMNRALGKKANKEEVFRLLQVGITDFFAQLVDVVGATVSSRPTLLPMKVIGSASVQPTYEGAPRRRSRKQTAKKLQREGLSPQTGLAKLIKARNATEAGLRDDLSEVERDDKKLGVEVLGSLIKRRGIILKWRSQARRQNKKSPSRA